MKLPSPGFLLHAFFQTFRRFPGALLAAGIGVIAVYALIDKYDKDICARFWMVAQLGLPLMIGIVAFAESKGWEEKRSWMLQGLGFAALAGYWFVLDTTGSTFEYTVLPKYLALLLVAHLFVAVAPYLNSRSVADFWEYNRQVFANIVVGGVFTFILNSGLSLAILAVDQLFDLHIDNRIYLKLFALLAGIFNTTYFLYHFPKEYTLSEADGGYNAIFKNLCKYILIPIVGLYFLILYTYGGKILATWNLPKGWVSSLVLGFSVAGIFTYLLNFYLPEHDDSAWVRAFRRWFWWVQLPLTALLFVAIAKRIGDYGVTEPRFLVAHLGVWLAATCLYFLFSKHDNIKFIPISLALFALLFAFGPFNALRVSERSQEKVLLGLLEKNGRLENGRLKPGTAIMPDTEVFKINSVLEFLDDRGVLSRMDWLPMPLDSFPQIRMSSAAAAIATWAGIVTQSDQVHSNTLTIESSARYSGLQQPTEIKGFQVFQSVELSDALPEQIPDGNWFCISKDGKRLEWYRILAGKSALLESFDLSRQLQKWIAGREKSTYESLPPIDLTFDLTGKKAVLRIVVTSVNISRKAGDPALYGLTGYLFFKEK